VRTESEQIPLRVRSASLRRQPERQRQRKKQVPCGNDNQKSKSNGKRRFPSGMTSAKGFPYGNDERQGVIPMGMMSARVFPTGMTEARGLPFGNDERKASGLGLRFWLELDTALGEDALAVGVFDFAHLGDGVG
jgi:hypothetical protein